VLIYKINPNQTEAILLDQSFNLAQVTKLITFIPTSDKIRIEIRYMNSDIGRFSTIDDIKLRSLGDYTTVYTNSFSSTVMTTNALDGWQPASWSTTSATLDYAGGNHRLVAIGSNATATVQRDFTTNANEQHSLSYNLALLNGGSATVKVQQKIGNTYYDLAGSTQTHTASGTYNFNFTPSEDDIRVVVAGSSRYALTHIFMDRNTIEEVVETYTLSAGGYRYGYQGSERDDEAKGKGNSYTTEFRQYDPRLGRWLSVDPVVKHHESPYAAYSNNPILFIDPNGADTLLLHLKEVESPLNDIILFKVTFTFIQDNVSHNLTPEDPIYVGMPRDYYNIPGNKLEDGKWYPLVNETGKRFSESFSKEWNENVIHLKDDPQYFHPAGRLSQSTGCFITSEYPTKAKNYGGFDDLFTSSDLGSDLMSKQKLFEIKSVYNEASRRNNDPTLDYFLVGNSEAKSSYINVGKLEMIKPVLQRDDMNRNIRTDED